MTILEYMRKLPIREITKLRLWFRNTFATAEWPEDVNHAETPIDVPQADALLHDAYFEDASGYSLKYEGEVLNLRRPAGYSPDSVEQETHLRARKHPEEPGLLQWIGHVEASRYTEQYEHAHQQGLEWLPAGAVAEILEGAGIPSTPTDP